MPSLTWFYPFFEGLALGVQAMLLHEAGHMIAAYFVGVKVKSIRLSWKGLYVVRESGTASKNLIISLAGPLANLVLIACWPLSPMFGLANLCFAFFNILPIEHSDGDRVLRCWQQMQRESSTSPISSAPTEPPHRP